MRVLILMASPRKNGNTASLLVPFKEELVKANVKVKEISLYEKDIKPCIACRKCQDDWSKFGCWYEDDVEGIFNDILFSDLIVFATPIYSWYCTAPMKSLMDRLVYGMNKYYGEKKGPSLGEGKNLALLTTCGYPPKKGSDLWEEGVKRYARHSKLNYRGSISEHDLGYEEVFINEDRENRVRLFARSLI